MGFAGWLRRSAAAMVCGIVVPVTAGCAGVGAASTLPCAASTGPIVVAAENSWGSIAAQLAGDRACVASIISRPDTDSHAYEARPNDARLVAGAKYFIFNGAGYDPWAPKLVAANPVPGRTVLNVADLNEVREGDNPHMWYSPAMVDRVVDRVARDLAAIDPANAGYYDQRRVQFKTIGLKDYTAAIATIRGKYAGTPVGASESIFTYLSDALGLNLVTPRGYLKAVSEGSDPSPADKAEAGRQISTRAIKVFVFNAQNSTPEVAALVEKAKAQKIPVTTVTETPSPAGVNFQQWQTGQLERLLAALGG